MRFPRSLVVFFRAIRDAVLHRRSMEDDMAAELKFHLDTRAEALILEGVAPGEARRRARLEFGAVEAYKESCREARGAAWLDELGGNLRYSLRSLNSQRGFTLAAVLSLAIGIGVNASCFASLKALVLEPFPYPHLERVMTLWETNPKLLAQRSPVAPANFFDWKSSTRAFEHLAAYRPADLSLTGTGDPERVNAALVSADFFSVLAMQPSWGRSFSERDCEPGGDAVVIVSHSFWKNRLAAVEDPIGTSVSLTNRRYSVVGVMPDEFDFPLATEVWTPLALSSGEKNERAAVNLMVLGRLKPGIPTGEARAEMGAAAMLLAQRYPQTNEARSVLVTPLRELTNEGTDRFTVMLWGAALFVLMLACANVANLQLSRATARQREIGLRAALGASRFRIARQLLTESCVIAILGGTAGLFLAYGNIQFEHASIPPEVFHWVAGLRTLHLDATVIALTFGLSLLAGTLCYLPAMYQLLRNRNGAGLNEVLKEGGRSASAGPSRSRARHILVVVEVALALVLLVGAGLMVRTFQRMLALDAGFNPKNVLAVDVALGAAAYHDLARVTQYYQNALAALENLPGVSAAGAAAGLGGAQKFSIEGRSDPGPGEPRPSVEAVSPHYLDAMGIPLLRGRAIGNQDGPDAPGVVVLSDSVARHYWPQGDAIGRRIRLNGPRSPWLTVVGVCGDIRDWFGGNAQPQAYLAYRQSPARSMRLLLRTVHDPLQLSNGVRGRMRTLDSSQPVFNLKSMEQILAEETSGVRIAAEMMAMYAAIALLLAVMGIYAVGSFFVAQRTQEIGVRMALGASRQTILGMVLAQSARTTGLGLLIGLLLAVLVTQVLSHWLYNVVPVEPLMFVLLTAVLGICAVIASLIPAQRAASVDAMIALRNE